MKKSRYIIELTGKVKDTLKDLAENQNITQAELFRRALALYDYAFNDVVNKGLKLTVSDNNDKVIKEIIMF